MLYRNLLILLLFFLSGCSFVAPGETESASAAGDSVASAPQVPLNPVVISGHVLAEPGSVRGKVFARQRVGSLDLVPLAADIVLSRCFSSGQCVELTRVQSDADGFFSFGEIDAARTGSGNAQDFYYMAVASTGENELRLVFAPVDDSQLEITPYTTAAAYQLMPARLDTLADVPVPSARQFRFLNHASRAGLMALEQDIPIPQFSRYQREDKKAFAEALDMSGTAASDVYRAFLYESEWLGLSRRRASAANQASYLRRVASDMCSATDGHVPMPTELAKLLAKAMSANSVFTPREIVAAYNLNNDTLLDARLNERVVAYRQNVLIPVEAKLEGDLGGMYFTSVEKLALFTLRGLNAETFHEDSLLEVDQALSFLYFVYAGDDERDLCRMDRALLSNTLASVTGDSELSRPRIVDVQLYFDEHPVCAVYSKKRFRAEVSVVTPPVKGENVDLRAHSVRIESTDVEALDANQSETRGKSGLLLKRHPVQDKFVANQDNACVTPDKQVTYTVILRLFNLEEVRYDLVTRHDTLPQYKLTQEGRTVVSSTAQPVMVKRRAVFGVELDTSQHPMPILPAGQFLKYKYEFAHVDSRNPGIAIFDCPPLQEGKSFDADFMMNGDACDIAACSAKSGIPKYRMRCRVNVRSVVVDAADRLMNQSTVSTAYMCSDTNGDNRCD